MTQSTNNIKPKPRRVRGTGTYMGDEFTFTPYEQGEPAQRNVKTCKGGKVYETSSEKAPLKVAYLTFDDGPDEKNTAAVLDILKKEGVKATFYVLGKNVTLTSTQGAVGTVEGTATTITAEELQKDITKMKALMNVDASDVEIKWSGDDKDKTLESFTIKRNLPLGVFLKEKSSLEDGTLKKGALNVQAGGDVSVAGRTDKAGEHSAINVGNINATNNGDVRLYSAKGIYNDLKTDDDNQTNITGRNLLLVGGEEKVSADGDERASIGTSDKPLTVSLTGALTEARSSENIYIKNMKQDAVLKLGAMYAGDTISLESKMGFLMREYKPNEDIAESYINAGKNLVFTADATNGVVGDADHAIRILNDRAPVNITAGSAYIRGVGSISKGVQNGTLLLGTINTMEEFTAVSDGSLSVGREEEKDSSGNVVKEKVEGSILSGGDVTLGAMDNLTLDGAVTAEDLENGKELTLTAFNGNIIQTDKGVITAETVNTFNGKSLLLENENNQFNSIIVDGIVTGEGEEPAINGNVRIKDNSDALTVTINRKVEGDISVTNLLENGMLTNGGNLTATGSINLAAEGDVTQAAGTMLTADKDVTLTSESGNVIQTATESEEETAGIIAPKVMVKSAKEVDLQGEDNQFGTITVQSSDENDPIDGTVSVLDSTEKLVLSIQSAVNGNITVENKTGELQVVSDLQANGDEAEAKGDITLQSMEDMQTTGTLTAGDSVNVTSVTGDVTTDGAVQAGSNVTLTSKDGAITIGAAVTAEAGKIEATAQGDLTTHDELSAELGEIALTSQGRRYYRWSRSNSCEQCNAERRGRQRSGRRCSKFYGRKRRGDGG